MRKIFFDEKLENEFLSKSFITVPLLSNEEVEYLLAEMYQLNPSDNYSPQGTYHATFLDANVDYKKKATNIVRDFFSEKLNNILVDYQFPTGGFLVKQPDCGEVPMHRDWTFAEHLNQTNINFWCALVDVDESNGALQMVAGSHKLVQNIEAPQSMPFYLEFSESLKEISTLVPLKKGEAIFFESSTLHWSTPNNSKNVRQAASLLCIPAEAKPVFYFPAQDFPNKKFNMYEMVNDAFDEHIGTDYFEGNLKTKVLACVENKNVEVSKEDFLSMLKNGEKIRQNIYCSHQSSQPTFWEKLKNYLKMS
ncbi:MAG TPA: phytanoyl-CoA dioxygenase family protein [Pyrinomonadaceae bacterium]|nr:phytanoyl-CoA dioxygenase family protein [Pyrinomonadaceae bacterium]